MKLKHLIFPAFLLFSMTVFAQSLDRFVKLYGNPPIDFAMRNIIVTDSNYILVGNGYNPNNQYHSEIIILWFDKYGNYQSMKTYGDTTYFFGPCTPYGNTLHKDYSGHYYLFFLKSNWDYSEVYNYIVKFDSQFDTLWTRQTFTGNWATTEAYGIFTLDNGIIDTSNNIYIVGSSSITENGDTINGYVCLYVEKLDSLGNQLWRHTYEIGHSYADNAVIDPQTNHLWIGGVSETRPGVYEIAPDGQLLWFHTFEVPFWIGTTPAFVSIIPGIPGTILVSGGLLWREGICPGFSGIIKNNQVVNHWYYEQDYTNQANSISARPILVRSDSTFIILEGLKEHFADTLDRKSVV